MNTNKFVIMYKDYPVSIVDFYTDGFPSEIREHNNVYITNELSKVSYMQSYDIAMSRLHLIRDAINKTNIRFSCSEEVSFDFSKPVNPNDFYIAEVSFNRYMPPAGNTLSDKFENVKYNVGDKVIFVSSGVIYVGKIEMVQAHSVDDLPANNNYTYDILATDKIELSKFTKTIQGQYQPIPITDTEVIFESVLEDTIIGLF